MAMWRKLSIGEKSELDQEARILNFGGNTENDTVEETTEDENLEDGQPTEEVLEEAILLSSEESGKEDENPKTSGVREPQNQHKNLVDVVFSGTEMPQTTQKSSDLFESEDSAEEEYFPEPEIPKKTEEIPPVKNKKPDKVPEKSPKVSYSKPNNFYGKKESLKKSERKSKKDFSNILSSSTTDTEGDEIPEIKLSNKPRKLVKNKKSEQKSSLILFDSDTSSESEDEKVLPKKKRKITPMEMSSSSSDGGETLFSMKKKIVANKTETPKSKSTKNTSDKNAPSTDKSLKVKVLDISKVNSKLAKSKTPKLKIEPDKKLKASIVLTDLNSRKVESTEHEQISSKLFKEATSSTKSTEKTKISQKDSKSSDSKKNENVAKKEAKTSSFANYKIPKKISPEQKEKEQRAHDRLKKRIDDLTERISGKTKRFKQMTTEKSKKKEKQSLDELRDQRFNLIRQLDKKPMSDEEKKMRAEIKFERSADYDLSFSDFEKTKTITIQATPKCQYHPCTKHGVVEIDKIKYCSQACLHKYAMDLHRMVMEKMFRKPLRKKIENDKVKRKKARTGSVEGTPPKKHAEMKKGSSGNQIRRLSNEQVKTLNKGLKVKPKKDVLNSEKNLKDQKNANKAEVSSKVTSVSQKNSNVSSSKTESTKEKLEVDDIKQESKVDVNNQSNSSITENIQSESQSDQNHLLTMNQLIKSCLNLQRAQKRVL